MTNLYTTKQAADRLDISPVRVRQLAGTMKLGTLYSERLRLFTDAEIQQMADRNTKPGPPRKDDTA